MAEHTPGRTVGFVSSSGFFAVPHAYAEAIMKPEKVTCPCCQRLLAALVEALNTMSVAQDDAANVGGRKCEEAKFFAAPIRKARAAIARATGEQT